MTVTAAGDSSANSPSITTPVTTPIAPHHFAFIDALRGYAILGVLAVHVGVCTPALPDWLAGYARLGATGVQLFFVISAFTLFWSLKTRTLLDRRPIAAFYVRRLFRIAPLFWVGIAFYYNFPDPWRPYSAPNGVGWPHLLTTIFFVHGWYPTTVNTVVPGGWSIAAEVMFYLCVPLLFSRIKTMKAAIKLVVVSSLAATVYFFFGLAILLTVCPESWGTLPETFLGYSFPYQFPVFCCGIVLYFLIKLRHEPALPTAAVDTPYFVLPQFAGLLVVVGVVVALRVQPLPVMSAVAFTMIAWAMSLRRFEWAINPAIRYLGKISYSAYIWHFWLLHHLNDWLTPRMHVREHSAANSIALYAVLYAALLAAAVVVASVSFYVIEQPAQRFGSALIKRLGWGEAPRPVLAEVG